MRDTPMLKTQRKINQIPWRRAAEFLWNETEGRIFSAYFQKKDGTMRNMTARVGVKAHLRGGDLPYDPKVAQTLPVFDMAISDYRMIPLARLVSFNIGGETFIVTPG